MNGANTRTSRWFGVVHGLLIGLFFDTLFFVTFFPPQNPCANFGDSHRCHSLPSRIIEKSTMCVWDVDTRTCALQSPPSSLYFTLVVTLMVILVIVPLEGFLGLIFEGFVVKRPDLEMWGLNSDSWFGTTQLPGTKVLVKSFKTSFLPPPLMPFKTTYPPLPTPSQHTLSTYLTNSHTLSMHFSHIQHMLCDQIAHGSPHQHTHTHTLSTHIPYQLTYPINSHTLSIHFSHIQVIKSPMALLMEAKHLEHLAEKEKADKAAAAALGLDGLSKYEAGKSLHAWDVEQQGSWDVPIPERIKNDGIALCLYSDQCSEKVEAEMLLEEVRKYINIQYLPLVLFNNTNYNIPK